MADPGTPPALPPPLPSGIPSPRTAPLAIVSLVLGILSLFCGWLFTAIPAVICGHVARSKIRQSGGTLAGKEIALAGLIVGYIGVTLGVLGIALLVGLFKADRERVQHLRTEKKEIVSDDGKLRVTTSGFWVKMSDLNDRASLQAGFKNSEMFVIVISDPKSALGNMSLAEHEELTRKHMMQKMTRAAATIPIPVTIDGHPALQDEVSGTTQGADLVFLHTTVNDGEHFQQILAWTTISRWPKQNAELRQVTDSFRSGQ